MTKQLSISVVEHDSMLGMLFLEVLAQAGYAAELWAERTGAVEFIRQTRPDVIIDVPLVSRLRTPATQFVGILLSELQRPTPHRFVAEDVATSRHQLFDITKTQRESVSHSIHPCQPTATYRDNTLKTARRYFAGQTA